MRLYIYLLKNAEKVTLASDSLHVVSGMSMLERAVSFHTENRIMNFSGTDIRLKNDNTRHVESS